MFEPEFIQVVIALVGACVALLFTFVRGGATWGKNKDKAREYRERSDKRSHDRKERDSIRKNFDLQRARMPNMRTEELIAFSQAANAEVNKRREAHMSVNANAFLEHRKRTGLAADDEGIKRDLEE